MQGGTCPLEKNSEGHDICTITGFCTKMLNFSDKEYMSNMCFSSLHGYDENDDGCFEEDDIHGMQASENQPESIDENDCSNNHKTDEEIPAHRRKKRQKKNKLDDCSSGCGGMFLEGPSPTVNKKNRYRSWVHHRIQANNRSSIPCLKGIQIKDIAKHRSAGNHQQQQQMQHNADKIGSLIDSYVWDILCSSRWFDSMQMEARTHSLCFSLSFSASIT